MNFTKSLIKQVVVHMDKIGMGNFSSEAERTSKSPNSKLKAKQEQIRFEKLQELAQKFSMNSTKPKDPDEKMRK